MPKKETHKVEHPVRTVCKKERMGCHGGIYCIGFIGALVYYISTATGFWDGVWGVIKALLWPGFLVYHLLQFLGV